MAPYSTEGHAHEFRELFLNPDESIDAYHTRLSATFMMLQERYERKS